MTNTTIHQHTDQVVVHLESVVKEYGSTAALAGVSIDIGAGEAVAVMGPSGCGKSTLLNMIAGLDAAQLTGTSAAQARRRALELFDELGIAHRRDTYPALLSGGERQRVAVARALMNRPAVLLADEPTGALDSHSAEQVMDLLIDLNQIGQTLVVVTHDEHLATRCASRVVRLSDGKVVAEHVLERVS
jgi:putative ABC transport system ATP-binding protein